VLWNKSVYIRFIPECWNSLTEFGKVCVIDDVINQIFGRPAIGPKYMLNIIVFTRIRIIDNVMGM